MVIIIILILTHIKSYILKKILVTHFNITKVKMLLNSDMIKNYHKKVMKVVVHVTCVLYSKSFDRFVKLKLCKHFKVNIIFTQS